MRFLEGSRESFISAKTQELKGLTESAIAKNSPYFETRKKKTQFNLMILLGIMTYFGG